MTQTKFRELDEDTIEMYVTNGFGMSPDQEKHVAIFKIYELPEEYIKEIIEDSYQEYLELLTDEQTPSRYSDAVARKIITLFMSIQENMSVYGIHVESQFDFSEEGVDDFFFKKEDAKDVITSLTG